MYKRQVEHLAFGVPDGGDILKDITLTVGSGRLVVVTGPNGGGKDVYKRQTKICWVSGPR